MTASTAQPEQLALIPVEPRPLTDRQQAVLDAVHAAGIDGIDADEIGALLCERRGKHGRGDRCRWCGQNGKGALDELAAKNLVRYRRARGSRPGAWYLEGTVDSTPALSGMLPDDQPLPF